MARRRKPRPRRGFRPYVPVARRQQRAALAGSEARQRGEALDPVQVAGRTIATTAWGRAWCEHIESFHDYSNRLPRGRTYVRNGSVYHLEILAGEIRARVMGSDDYEQLVKIEPCKTVVWKRVRRRCAGGIGSLIELLEGRISSEVMASMTAERDGLLPDLNQVALACTCPDWASLCKHLAAVLYGVGARLDERPELLFKLRGVDPAELVDGAGLPSAKRKSKSSARKIEGKLSDVFGIELEESDVEPAPAPVKPKRGRSGTESPRSERRGAKVRRGELLDAGVPPGTIGAWLRQGVLEANEERGVYRHTRESRLRLKRYGEELGSG